MDTMTIGIIANIDKPKAGEILGSLMLVLERHDLDVVVEENSARLLNSSIEKPVAFDEMGEHVDLIIVLGGDGTILNAARRLGAQRKPLMGINIGALGFLTYTNQHSLDKVGEWIVNHHYRLSPRAMIEVSVHGAGDEDSPTYYGLNEATVSRGSVSRIIQLETRIGGEFVNNYNADGLIVATPTGSTAYSLSAGGPIIDPESGVFVITPICPHALSNRSMIVADSAEVEIIPVKPRDQVILTIDGRTLQDIEPGASVRVKRSPWKVELAFLPDQSFYRTIRQKLHWHGSNIQV
ncbi:MAG: NAD(+)/NADH kinase [Verrucomicrobiota bacterium]